MAYDGELYTERTPASTPPALLTRGASPPPVTTRLRDLHAFFNGSPRVIYEGLARLEALIAVVERLPVYAYDQGTFGGRVSLGWGPFRIGFFRGCAMAHAHRLGMVDNLDGGATTRNAQLFGLTSEQAAFLFGGTAGVNSILRRPTRLPILPRDWVRAARLIIGEQRAGALKLAQFA